MGGRSRPNILYVFTDQQQAGMMGCAGNPYVRTPAMDGRDGQRDRRPGARPCAGGPPRLAPGPARPHYAVHPE